MVIQAAPTNEKKNQLLENKQKIKASCLNDEKDIKNDNKSSVLKKIKTDHTTGQNKIKSKQVSPQLSYQELLKVAEKIQHEKIKKVTTLPLMSKKQKEKYLEEKKIASVKKSSRTSSNRDKKNV